MRDVLERQRDLTRLGASARELAGAAATLPDTIAAARRWAGILALIPLALAAAALAAGPGPTPAWLLWTIVAGLLAFGVVCALNSALHSYLILAFSPRERVTLDVGFYYMANAAGRLLGTLLSGLSYQAGGLPLCLGTAAAMAGASWLCARRLARRDAASADAVS